MADSQSGGIRIDGDVGDVLGQIAGRDARMVIDLSEVGDSDVVPIDQAFMVAREFARGDVADTQLRLLEKAVLDQDQEEADRLQDALWKIAPRAMEVLLMTLPAIFKMVAMGA